MPLKPVLWMGSESCQGVLAVTDVLRLPKSNQPVPYRSSENRRAVAARATELLMSARRERHLASREATRRKSQHQLDCCPVITVPPTADHGAAAPRVNSLPLATRADVHSPVTAANRSLQYDFEDDESVENEGSQWGAENAVLVSRASVVSMTPSATTPIDAMSFGTEPEVGLLAATAPYVTSDPTHCVPLEEEHIYLSSTASATSGTPTRDSRRRPAAPPQWAFDDQTSTVIDSVDEHSIRILDEDAPWSPSPEFHPVETDTPH